MECGSFLRSQNRFCLVVEILSNEVIDEGKCEGAFIEFTKRVVRWSPQRANKACD